jgi:hypothetical protein
LSAIFDSNSSIKRLVLSLSCWRDGVEAVMIRVVLLFSLAS